MIKEIDPSALTDRELLLVMHTNLTNHLIHHDFWTKLLLGALLVGAINFFIGVALIFAQVQALKV